MFIGAHFSVRKGFVSALEQASRVGCDALQFFSRHPRGWRTRTHGPEEFHDFRAARLRLGLAPVVLHAPYLPNLSSARSLLHARSVEMLVDDLRRSAELGADYLVIHPGAYSLGSDAETGLRRFSEALNTALAAVPESAVVLIENVAGGGRRLGGDFEELGRMVLGVADVRRVGVCFDTCHALGAGYDLTSPAGVDATLAAFEKAVGLDRIHVFHANDAEAPRGSRLDIHGHLGEGHIGLANLARFFRGANRREAAYILETPRDRPDADAENLAKLRRCLEPWA